MLVVSACPYGGRGEILHSLVEKTNLGLAALADLREGPQPFARLSDGN